MMMDMRYMWSDIDSPWLMPNRRQPSRLVVFSRSSRWKKGTGEEVWDVGRADAERVERTVDGVHWFGVSSEEVPGFESSLRSSVNV